MVYLAGTAKSSPFRRSPFLFDFGVVRIVTGRTQKQNDQGLRIVFMMSFDALHFMATTTFGRSLERTPMNGSRYGALRPLLLPSTLKPSRLIYSCHMASCA